MDRINWRPGSPRLVETILTDGRQDHSGRAQVQLGVPEELPNFSRSYYDQEPEIFRNPSPPYFPDYDTASRRNVSLASRSSSCRNSASPHILPKSTTQNAISEHLISENLNEPVDPMLFLIEVNNRFSRMVLTKESITQEDSSIGFLKFHEINQIRALHCWQKQIGSSNRPSVAIAQVKGPIEENDIVIDRKPVKTEADHFTDPYAQYRCKRFLRGRACDGRCQKVHKFPKEDGVKCVSQMHGQCRLGRTCNFVHEVSSDESDSDDGGDRPSSSIAVKAVVEKLKRSSTVININNTKHGTSAVPLNEMSSSTIGSLLKNPFDGCTNGSDKVAKISNLYVGPTSNAPVHDSSADSKNNVCADVNSTLKIKQEPVELDRAKDEKKCANSSSSSYSSTTTMTTSTTLSQSSILSGVKRKAHSLDKPCSAKKERIDEPIVTTDKTNVSLGLAIIKSEPPDVELFKEETVENMDYTTGSQVKSEVMNGHHLVEPATTATPEDSVSRKIVVPAGYVLPSTERLNELSLLVCNVIRDLESTESESDPDPTSDPYFKISQYLQVNGVPVLSELSNPKILIWDIHIRLFLSALMEIDTQDYFARIECHLASEPFEDFISRAISVL